MYIIAVLLGCNNFKVTRHTRVHIYLSINKYILYIYIHMYIYICAYAYVYIYISGQPDVYFYICIGLTRILAA